MQRRVITMAAPPPYPMHSIADAAARIDQGEDPWFALGCFLHDWWCYAVDHRQDLISEPPAPAATQEGRRWAAFCAAQQHPSRLNGATSSLAGAFLTTSTNFNTPLTRNLGGPPGRIRNSRTWRERTRCLPIEKRGNVWLCCKKGLEK